MSDSQLTPAEEKSIILQAQLAKIDHHLAKLRERALKIFSVSPGSRVEHHHEIAPPPLKPVDIHIDLLLLRPGEFTRAAESMEELVKEIREAIDRHREIVVELRQISANVNVTVEFPSN